MPLPYPMDETIESRSPRTEEGSLSIAVVEAIAERAGVEPLELDRPLYDAIDPGALENLFPVDGEGRPATDGHVTFSYGEYTVRVGSDRRIQVFGPGDDGPEPAPTEGQ